jgi:chemotaxis protein MotB
VARKKYTEEHENHERWLVSYADFMTLLFAFFVVMYAISSVNSGKYRVLSSSLIGAFGAFSQQSGEIPTLQAENEKNLQQLNIINPLSLIKQKSSTKVQESLKIEKERMTSVARDILSVLEPLVREGKVKVTQTSRGITIEINASVLFALAEAKLSQESNQTLTAIASVLVNDNHDIQVEGFTDNLPIKNSTFPSNWELSAVRASTVARLFAEVGIKDQRLTAIGQGPKSPVGLNDSVEGRARNRRVEITILSVLPETGVEIPISPKNKN